jgi:hypothetical protein
MKLPTDAIIALEKLMGYLLADRPRGDKSRFLAEAGYTMANPEQLRRDLREQVLSLDATPLPPRGYGDVYEIRGILRGPNGVGLPVRTIWMRERATGRVKLITLVPLRRERP